MTLRTADQYRAGLRDGRKVVYRGEEVADILTHPQFIRAVEHSSLGYDIHESHPELAVTEVDGDPRSFFWNAPRTIDDLIRRGRLIEQVSRLGGGTIVLKEVGSDALFALLRATWGAGNENARRYVEFIAREDLSLAVAQTDVKGNRALGPSQQADPDLYLHIVAEDAESITVRGAKTHTSFAPNVDEIVVLPTRAMGPDDAAYAVSFAIPVDTPGLTLYVSSFADGEPNEFEHPLSSRHKLLESLTVFDDVRVPKDRVFLNGVPEHAGPLALAFVDYHRFTAINYKLPLLDQIVGAAILVAEANGIANAGHVKSKLTELITWAETVRGLAELSALRGAESGNGVFRPDPLTVNMAKYHFAHGFSAATSHLIDLAGGLLITGPGAGDWAKPEVRAVLEKYYAGAVPGEARLRIANFVSDLTARGYGGYQRVLATHAEGSFEAEKLQILRAYDSERAVDYVRGLARVPR
ncbi:aromatic ring hydroxylase [Microbacterium terrae]|uniref:4-hydroxybutyryl-CoA dehydratase/vinylacetyl-CoA-Delta-isomerase n=1 Tax=Microbacterium terrae TaxID=69369 RepID=A0A0M2GUY7_9MICO|nr:4-hydroxyphenylacetate 3-hydroxylase N-terminal domain-containing protein [Microbacterium terrae]KJL37501.1 4-hydroxybutyryl-CoA dehydratase/vinylacetyl-CoA-Delta-isomerase [Microbacterium terrae]MBP1076330.1 aromatic ring hydroxylase [Microbacterium terrae]GLJ97154.1 4-hydroxybutyryl-CoA dehydratase [Microbacterium terrae]